MDKNSGTASCTIGCWLVATLVGALCFVMLLVVGGWTFMQAIFVGAILFVATGALTSALMCRPLPPPGSVTVGKTQPDPVKSTPPSESAAPTPNAPAPSSETVNRAATAVDPDPAPEPARPASVAAAPVPAPEPVARDTRADTPEPAPASAKAGASAMPGAAAAPAPEPAEPVIAPPDGDVEEVQPDILSGPRPGGADDLKLLKGVGPKLEQTLNELGFYHFDQIAAWSPAQVAWVDSRLKFKGRIERDGWIEQAKTLAAGGETEFSARNK